MTGRARALAGIAGLLGVWCAGFLVPELHLALLYVAPVLLLATALLAGRYPGAVLLERIARRRRRPARPRAAAGGSPPRGPARMPARGGLLLARALAGRAPPGHPGGLPLTNS